MRRIVGYIQLSSWTAYGIIIATDMLSYIAITSKHLLFRVRLSPTHAEYQAGLNITESTIMHLVQLRYFAQTDRDQGNRQ